MGVPHLAASVDARKTQANKAMVLSGANGSGIRNVFGYQKPSTFVLSLHDLSFCSQICAASLTVIFMNTSRQGMGSAGRKTYVSVVSLSHLQTTHTSPENKRKKINHLRTKYYFIVYIKCQL